MSRVERQFPRYAVEAEINLRAPGRHALRGRTANVSRGGVCVSIGAPFTVGETVDVELQLVFDEDSFSEPLALPARVVWCTDMGDVWQLGMGFRSLSAEQGRYVDLFLRYLHEGQARRAAELEDRDREAEYDPFATD